MNNQLILFLWICAGHCFSQSNLPAPPHPEFSSFKGDVYKLAIVEEKRGKGTFKGIVDTFGEHIFDYEKIAHIDLPELNIPKTDVNKAKFPGVDRAAGFGMVLESEVEIKVDGCYEFSLNSDDGSILWIDEKEIVNNDGNHGMRLRKDSIVLGPGTYPVKVWYLQAYVTEYGLILNGKLVGKPEVCPSNDLVIKEILTFNPSVLFATGSAKLNSEAHLVIDTIVMNLKNNPVKKLTIVGHTDNRGSERHNMQLSFARANSLQMALKAKLDDSYEIESMGKGETEPVADNNTAEGRQANRRVEIILE